MNVCRKWSTDRYLNFFFETSTGISASVVNAELDFSVIAKNQKDKNYEV